MGMDRLRRLEGMGYVSGQVQVGNMGWEHGRVWVHSVDWAIGLNLELGTGYGLVVWAATDWKCGLAWTGS